MKRNNITKGITMLLATAMILQIFPSNLGFALGEVEEQKVKASFTSSIEEMKEHITIVADSLNENIKVTGILLPDETFIEDDKAQFTASENGDYNFTVYYQEKIEGENILNNVDETILDQSILEEQSEELEEEKTEEKYLDDEIKFREESELREETNFEQEVNINDKIEHENSEEVTVEKIEEVMTTRDTTTQLDNAKSIISQAHAAINNSKLENDDSSYIIEGFESFTYKVENIEQKEENIDFLFSSTREHDKEIIKVSLNSLSDDIEILGIKLPSGEIINDIEAEFVATNEGEYEFEAIYRLTNKSIYSRSSLNNVNKSEVAKYSVFAFGETDESWFKFDDDTQTIVGYSGESSAPKNIVIPKTIRGIEVLHIGENAFAGQQLIGFVLNDNLKTIGNSAFENNNYIMNELTIPSSVTTIGSKAFVIRNSISKLNLSYGLEYIGDSAFEDWQYLSSVVIPDSVTYLGEKAFYNNYNLQEVTLSNSITAIKSETFARTGLKTITIPDSVLTIVSNAFESTDQLIEIKILTKDSNSIVGAPWGSYATVYWRNIYNDGNWLFDKDSKSITKYIGTDSYVIMPDHFVIDGINYEVESFNSATFQKNNNIRKITLPNIIKNIPTNAFRECRKLEEVILPNQLNSISDNAFYGCRSLTNVILPSQLKSIGEAAFAFCNKLESITIPDSVIFLGDNTFMYSGLSDVNIGSGITTLPAMIFSGCKLTDLAFLKTITIIGESAFIYNSFVGELTIPSGVVSIGKGAFYHSIEITKVNFPEGLKSIEEEAFRNCTNLESVTIPSSVETIGTAAFYDTPNLKTIDITSKNSGEISGEPWRSSAIVNWRDTITTDEWVYSPGESLITKYLGTDTNVFLPTSIEVNDIEYEVKGFSSSTFMENKNLNTIEIPVGITSIPEYAFRKCENLISVKLPETVNEIEESAFTHCYKLESINLPKNLKIIKNGTFADCISLKEITIPENVISIEYLAFAGAGLIKVDIPDNVTILDLFSFAYCERLEEVSIGSGIKIISRYAFRGSDNVENIYINLNRSQAPSGVTVNQPWGADSAKIEYLDDNVTFEYEIDMVDGKYERIIKIRAYIENNKIIETIELPDGNIIGVGQKIWPGPTSTSFYSYKVDENNTFTFSGKEGLVGEERSIDILINNIGAPTLTANNANIHYLDVPSITEEVLEAINAKATTKELGDDFTGGSIRLEAGELDKIKGLFNNGDTTNVKVVATSPTGLTDSKEVSIKLASTITVEFETNGSIEAVASQQLMPNELVSKPSTITRDGYTFKGWYRESSMVNLWNFDRDTVGNLDMTLYAGWEKETSATYHTLKYNTNGGSTITSQKVRANQNVILDKVPTKNGYSFEGWYEDITLHSKITSIHMNKDKTVYAKWIKDGMTNVIPDNTKYPKDPTIVQVSPDDTERLDTEVRPQNTTNTGGNTNTNGSTNTSVSSGSNDIDKEDYSKDTTIEKDDSKKETIQRTEFGNGRDENCILHWVLFLLAALIGIFIIAKRKRNKRETNS